MLSPEDDKTGLDIIPLVGLLGHNIGYSISPMLHEAADDASGPIHDYHLFDVPIHNLEIWLERVTGFPGITGFNVTVPHKEVLSRRLTSVQDSAREVGAVNVVEVVGKDMIGYNTDRPALVKVLDNAIKSGEHPESGWTVVLIGAGGAARAAIWALIDTKIADRVIVTARNKRKLQSFVNDYLVAGSHFGVEVEEGTWLDWENLEIESPALLVNATPLGSMDSMGLVSMPVHGPPNDTLSNFSLVLDMVYSPPVTGLMTAARDAGVEAIGGIGMLIEQAVLSRAIWFGSGNEDIERAVMEKAYEKWAEEISEFDGEAFV